MAPSLKIMMKAIMAERTEAMHKRKREAYAKELLDMIKRTCLPVEKTSQEDRKPCLPHDNPAMYLDHEEDLCAMQEEATVEDGLMTVSLLKHQRMALAWMEKREALLEGLPRGGILADDQGLGKTILAMALILKNRSPRPVGNDGHGGTLVVCPTSVVRQWAAELKTKSSRKADLTVLLYHGPSRTKHEQELGMYDVVLTTYDIVALENPTPKSWKEDGVGYNGDFLDIEQWRVGQARAQSRVENNALKKKNKKTLHGPLSKIKWFRVILDEAQCIRTASTITARAVWGLDTERRWCLSGTPLQNRLGDLYSYLRFFQYPEYELYVEFHNRIKRFADKSSPDPQFLRYKAEAYKLVRNIFKNILLRRTKTTKIQGQPILYLPPRIVNLTRS